MVYQTTEEIERDDEIFDAERRDALVRRAEQERLKEKRQHLSSESKRYLAYYGVALGGAFTGSLIGASMLLCLPLVAIGACCYEISSAAKRRTNDLSSIIAIIESGDTLNSKSREATA